MVLYKVPERDQDPDLKYLHEEALQFCFFLKISFKKRKKHLPWERGMWKKKRKQQEGIQRWVDILRLN